ncbi:MAG: creatininase family protein [Desulfurococcaceae archaeon]
MEIERLTSFEFEEIKKKVLGVIIPIGSIEAHGPHLPLATDLYTIYEIAKRVAKEVPVLIAPPVYYGLCRSTRDLPGTLSIQGETLKLLLLDIMESLYRQGLRTFALLSGHAGGTHNCYILDAGETFLEHYKDTRIFVADIAKLLRDLSQKIELHPQDSHAGDWETSLMMHLKPEVVKNLDQAFEDYPAFPKYELVTEKTKFWHSGIWGNPKLASPEKGKKICDLLVKKLVELFLSGSK